jgi:hypothetical protein
MVANQNKRGAALAVRGTLDDFIFHTTDDILERGTIAELDPLKMAIILETYEELLDLLQEAFARFGRTSKAAKLGMLSVVSDPGMFERFNPDHQAEIRKIASGTSLLAKRRLERLLLAIRVQAGKFIPKA